MEVWLTSNTLPFSYDCSVSVNYKTEFYPSCSRPHSSGSFELSFFFQDGQWIQFLSLGEKAVMEEKKRNRVKRNLLRRILFCNQDTLQRTCSHLSASVRKTEALKETNLPKENLL